jgi:hypothetical protein
MESNGNKVLSNKISKTKWLKKQLFLLKLDFFLTAIQQKEKADTKKKGCETGQGGSGAAATD